MLAIRCGFLSLGKLVSTRRRIINGLVCVRIGFLRVVRSIISLLGIILGFVLVFSFMMIFIVIPQSSISAISFIPLNCSIFSKFGSRFHCPQIRTL